MFASYRVLTIALVCFPVLSACGGSTAASRGGERDLGQARGGESIGINQVGYLTSGEKLAVVPAVPATQFELRSTADDAVVYSGDLSAAAGWGPAGDERVKKADFSAFTQEGEFYLRVTGTEDSAPFLIGENPYSDLHDAVLKAYYFNRASTALSAEYAGEWARRAGHPDTAVRVHATAATASRPEGTEIAAPKGWYDAGDFGKYTVNSGISVHTLLSAYEHFPEFYESRDVDIPESGDAIPDILNEVRWNLDWLASMQDEDGSVYHKLSALSWPGEVMPAADDQPRYVIGKSTAAALDFAAVMAQASRVYVPFYPTEAGQWLEQAQRAWDWASANPNASYSPGEDGDNGSGAYGDDEFSDEFAWAAAEMYLATEDDRYLEAFRATEVPFQVPAWRRVGVLAHISLVASGESLLGEAAHAELRAELVGFADSIVAQYGASAYAVPMVEADFRWGSNSQAANKAVVLMQAYRETGDPAYRDAATSLVSYILGRNPTGYSFVTGFGHKSPVDIHHRQSRADGVAEPIRGFLAGGPHDGQQDNCNYPSNEKAKSYFDGWCSYSTNEVTINWNAPLLYTLAAMMAE